MNEKTGCLVETPHGGRHAERAAAYRQMLEEIVATMTATHGDDHPWIPGADCKPLLDKIKKLLVRQ